MSKQFLLILSALTFVFLSGCAKGSSDDAAETSAATTSKTPKAGPSATQPSATAADPVVRPTQQEIILARSLSYKSDSRISYCEVLESQPKSYSGFRDQQLVPLASLSKVITTAWALQKLGPDFKFKTTWFLKPVSGLDGVFDAYLKSNFDPVFNIEKVLYSLSLLREKGVTKIRNLVIDETTRVYLSVLSQPHTEMEQTPISSRETIQNLELILNSENWSTQTETARNSLTAWANANGRALNIPATFSVEHVQLKNAAQIDSSIYSSQVSFSSSSLLKYLKNMNVYSSNYIADALFQYLGGVNEFSPFQTSILKLGAKDLKIYTGSGLADTSSGFRKDNLGTCLAMINILKYVNTLAEHSNINLGYLLYNPAQDLDGTFTSDLSFSNQVVLKTGRLYDNPALNLAGIISTSKGPTYFTFLGHDFSEGEESQIESARDSLLNSALDYYPTQQTFRSTKQFQIFIN